MTDSFKTTAEIYRQLGYTPIPIREGTKRPEGSWRDADKWDNNKYFELESDPRAERWGVGLVTAGLVVLDVDSAEGHRKDADGVAAFQRLQDELGALPPTYTNTARGEDSASRHYLFRLPEAYKGKKLHAPAAGVDLRDKGGQILVWPSIHPDTKTPYKWYGKDGKETGAPLPSELPELPEAWCERLTRGTAGGKKTHEETPVPSVRSLIAGTRPPSTANRACKAVETAYRKWSADPGRKGARHDTTRDAIYKLASMHEEGHVGAIDAIRDIAAEFPPLVADSRTGGYEDAGKEVQGMIDGVQNKLNAIPTVADPCTTYRPTAVTKDSATSSPAKPATVGFSMTELMAMQFKPLEWLIPNLLAIGTILLVAPPKKGKSWLALELAYQIATGGKAFGAIPVPQRPVLYMALEDGPRRLRNRLSALDCTTPTDQLRFVTDTEDITSVAENFLHDHAENKPLVILDTLAKYTSMCPTDPAQNAYERDYMLVGTLQRHVIDLEGSLLLIHHTNKNKSGDMVDTVSGTNGIAGAADAIISLDRARFQEDAVLRITSRDAPEGEYAMTFTDNRWRLQGGSLEAARDMVAETVTRARAGDNTAIVLDLLRNHPEGVSPALVAEETSLNAKHAANRLTQLVEKGLAVKVGRGRYRCKG